MSKCLISLENQTVLPNQIIIIDDCSTDDSFMQLENYSANSKLNIISVKNQTNCGPGKSRENGLLYVESNYVAFCDCDDWYEDDFVEKIKNTIESNNKIDLVIFDNYICIENQEKRVANITNLLSNKSKMDILALYPMSLWRFVLKREIMNGIVCPAIYNGEDGAVAAQIIVKANTIKVLPEPFYNYYYNDNSASIKPSQNAYLGLIEAFNVLKQTIPASYREQVEFLGIKFVCYGAVLNAFKAGVPIKLVRCEIDRFEDSYSKWSLNRYIHSLDCSKRLFLFCVRKHLFILNILMAKLHGYLTRK